MTERLRLYELAMARAVISLFTPERPLMLLPSQYKAMGAAPELADLMDRVRLIEPIPTGLTASPKRPSFPR